MSNLYVSFIFPQIVDEGTTHVIGDLTGYEDEEPVKNFLSGEKTHIDCTLFKWVTEEDREYGLKFTCLQSRDFFLYVFRTILSPVEREMFNRNLQLSGDDGCPCLLSISQDGQKTTEEIEILRFIIPKITPMKGASTLL